MFYTIDYNDKTDTFQALFMHGTSSAALGQIFKNGLIQPNFEMVIEEIIADAPWLGDLINSNHDLIRGGILGINSRIFENDIVFATWLGNWSGLQFIKSEIGRVVNHGGEVYTVTWNRIKKIADDHGLDAPPFRFLNAQIAVILFQVDFSLNMHVQPHPQAKYQFFETMAEFLSQNSFGHYKDIKQVKFLETLPAEQIFFHGTVEDVAARLSKDLISPAALAALARNRNL